MARTKATKKIETNICVKYEDEKKIRKGVDEVKVIIKTCCKVMDRLIYLFKFNTFKNYVKEIEIYSFVEHNSLYLLRVKSI